MGGIYSVPYFIDWDSKKDNLLKSILADTGVNVEISSKVKVQSFPMLKLTVTGLQASINSGQQQMKIFTASEVDIKFSLLKLLQGKVELSNLVFTNGTVTVDTDVLGAGGSAKFPKSYFSNAIISKFELENFQIVFTGSKYQSTRDNVNLIVNIGNDINDLDITGSYAQDAKDTVNLAFVTQAAKNSVSLKLYKQNGFNLTYTGSYNGDLMSVVTKGDFAITMTNLSDSAIFIDNPFPFLGYLTSDLISSSNTELKGSIDLASGDLHATNISITSPIVSGTGSYDYLTSSQIVSSAVNLDLKTLNLKGLKVADINKQKEDTNGEQSADDSAATSSDSILLGQYVGNQFFDLNSLSNNDSKLAISIDEIDYDGGSIKNLKLDGSITKGNFKLSNLDFDFSSGTKLSLSNVYSETVDKENVLIGDIEYKGTDLQGQIASTALSNYVKINPNTPFSFQSQVILAQSELTFIGINASFGNGSLTGRWTVQTHDPTKNKYDIDLSFADINFNELQADKFSTWINSLFNGSAEKAYYASFVPLREIATNALAKLTFSNCSLNKAIINNFTTQLNISPAKLDFKNSKLDSNFANLAGEFVIESSALRPNINANLSGSLLNLDLANKYLFNVDDNAAAVPAVQASSASPNDGSDSVSAQTSTTPASTAAGQQASPSVTQNAAAASTSSANSDSAVPASASAAQTVAASASSSQINADSPVSAITNIPLPSLKDMKPYWSMDQFNYFRIDKFDGAIDLKIDKVVYKNIEFDNMDMESTLRDNVWYLNYVKANLFGGNLLAKGDINRKTNQVEASISAALNNFSIENVKIGNDPIENIQGKASVSGSFYSIGATPYDFMNGLSASITFAIRDMTVQGMNLNRIILIAAGLEPDVDKTDVLSQLDLAYKSGSTNYKAIDGTLTTSKGIMQTKNVTFQTQYSNGYLSSSVDVRYMIINALLEYNFMPKQNQLQNLKMQILGPYNKLEKAVDDKNLVTYVRDVYGIPLPVVPVQVKPEQTEFIYQKVIK